MYIYVGCAVYNFIRLGGYYIHIIAAIALYFYWLLVDMV